MAALALAGYTVLAESLLERHTALKVAAISTVIGFLLVIAAIAAYSGFISAKFTEVREIGDNVKHET